jgi:hypothetical protein
MFSKAVYAIVAGSLPASVLAGIVVDVARYDGESDEPDSTITLYAQDGNLRMDQIDEEQKGSRLLFLSDRILDIDLSEQHYAVIERARLRAAQRSPNPTATLRADLLAEVPPARRYQVERLLTDPLRSAPQKRILNHRITSQQLTAFGGVCRVYRVEADGELMHEYCMLPEHAGMQEVMETSERMSALMSDFFDTLGLPWMQDAMQLWWTHAYAISGVPVLTREFEEGAVISEFRILQVRSAALPSETFDPPDNLRPRAVLDFPFGPDDPITDATGSGSDTGSD